MLNNILQESTKTGISMDRLPPGLIKVTGVCPHSVIISEKMYDLPEVDNQDLICKNKWDFPQRGIWENSGHKS